MGAIKMTTQYDIIDATLEFNRAANRPEEWTPSMVAKHTGYQLEELAEKLEAIAGTDIRYWTLAQLARDMQSLGQQFKRGNFDGAVASAPRGDLLDADVDLVVVSVGSMQTSGADVRGACSEVARSNLAKLVDGKAIFDENKKIKKPEGWTPPNLAPYVGK
jgi:predicted HAD superfamily Cof-like phosphohydrolase